jgi:[ribosomal protein S18]-alanine N-acetyltransferase
VRLTRLGPAHLAQVVAIEGAVQPRPWTARTFEEELARTDRCYLVVVDRGEVLGYAGLAVGAGEAHVLTVAVAPAHRRRGHGARLVAALLDEAVRRGAAAVTLEVRASAAGAQRLYQRAGFASAGVRPGYYDGGGEGAVIMWWYPPDGPG